MQTDKEPSSKGMTWALALVLAMVVGSLQESLAGGVVGALLGALLAQVLHLRSRTKALADQLNALQSAPRTTAVRSQPGASVEADSGVSALRAAAEQTSAPAGVVLQPQPDASQAQQAPTPVSAPSAAPAAAAAAQPATTPVRPVSAWDAIDKQTAAAAKGAVQTKSSAASATPPQGPRGPSVFDTALTGIVDWFKGGNPLARIGIVILFLGAVFLAKYAVDNDMFPIELRFIALAVGAFALLIIGWRLHEKRPSYGQLLQGGGIAGLYLTVFAAVRLYQLLPIGLALGLLIVVAVAAAIIAVAQNALSLAVIGTAGGFLAPVLLSTGGGSHVALFTYYAILNLGVFTVAWFRTWKVLNVLGFLFTFTITGLWRATGYEPYDLWSADAFLVLFFLMYVAVSVLNCVRQPPNLKGYVSGSLVFGLPVVAFTLHASLVSKIEYGLAWSAFTLGAFYLILGWTLFRTRRETFRLLVESFAALGVIFASLAIPLAFDTRTTAAMWAVEGAGLFWLGVRQERKLARAFGALLQVAAGVGYVAGLYRLQATWPILNTAYLGTVLLGVSGLLTGYWLYRNREKQASYEAGAELVFALWGVAWWLFGGLQEIQEFLPQGQLGCSLIFVALTAAILAVVGTRARWPLSQTIALYLPAVAGVIGLAYVINVSHPLAQWGESGWLLLFAVQYGLLYLVDKQKLTASVPVASGATGVSGLHAGACWVLTLLIAWEVSWQVEYYANGVWPSLPWGLAPALLLALIGREPPRPAWPVARFTTLYRTLGAIPVAIATMVWIIYINLGIAGDPGWLPYFPLLNPLDVSVALCLAALGLWWTSLTLQQRGHLWAAHERGSLAVAAGLVFLWLNSALIRALHHNWGAPITPYGIMNSTLVQTSLSIFWGLLGFTAMTVAARQKWRHVWMVGAILMVIVVAKLFLIDLSSIGTVARITSFLSVGVLLLITGYFAPLPPRTGGEGASEEAAK